MWFACQPRQPLPQAPFGYHRLVLDLKAKLAAAGLVSKEDIARAEAKRAGGGGGRRAKPEPAPPGLQPKPAVLRTKNKGEIYDAVRKFVDRVRLDVVGAAPTEAAEQFHFPAFTGRIGRLTLEPPIVAGVRDGSSAIVAYMSNHGLAHAVVLAAAGREIAEVMPLWLRVLQGEPSAGQIEAPAPNKSEPPAR